MPSNTIDHHPKTEGPGPAGGRPRADNAIEMLETRDDVRMLITDINMPGAINGLNLAATVRDRWPLIKIIITTGRERPKIEEVPAGSLYLRKPYTPGSVRAAVLSLF